MEFDNKHTVIHESDGSMQIMDFLLLCISKWYWFMITILIALGITIYMVKSTAPTYSATASILIKQQQASNFGGLEEIGLTGQKAVSVSNEISVMGSRSVLLEVVKDLNLNVEYYRDGMFYQRLLYGVDLPVSVDFIDCSIDQNVSLVLTFKGGEDFVMTGFSGYGLNDDVFNTIVSGSINDTIQTPIGAVVVEKTLYYRPIYMDIYVQYYSYEQTAAECKEHFSVVQIDDRTSIIDLEYKDISRHRAEDVLSKIIDVYSKNWIADRNQTSISTALFIADRLNVIEQELGEVDSDISAFKSKNLVADAENVASTYVAQITENAENIRALEEQIKIAYNIQGYLIDASNKYQLLPANTGLNQGNVDGLLHEYNAALIDHIAIVGNGSEHNPVVAECDAKLASMREIIVETLNNILNVLNNRLAGLQKEKSEIYGKIANTPLVSQYLLSTERQQSVKEQLYLYLLQKREENEISQAFTAYNTRVVSAPIAGSSPIAPEPNKMYVVAFIIGLFIPLMILFFKEVGYSKVRGRSDLKYMTVPFLAEIPLAEKGGLLKKKTNRKRNPIVVKADNRNFINEAFRVLRTNLEFVIGRNDKHRVIMITSINPGGGKTFLISNTAVSFALRNKKVLMIDFDMRKASLSKITGRHKLGVANYLNGDSDNINEFIVKSNLHEKLDILPVGTLPPNPIELLREERMPQMIAYLREQYDIIFIDTPPVELVADTSIINTVSDLTLFVVRAELLDREMLPVIEKYYQEGTLNNMNIILNGTRDAYGRYGYHRYGYRYGYQYGYGGRKNKYYNSNE